MVAKHITISSKGLTLDEPSVGYTATITSPTGTAVAETSPGLVIEGEGFRFAAAHEFYGRNYKPRLQDFYGLQTDNVEFTWHYCRELETAYAIGDTVELKSIKGLETQFATQELLELTSGAGLEDTSAIVEELSSNFVKTELTSLLFSEAAIIQMAFGRSLLDTATISEEIGKNPNKGLLDTSTIQETLGSFVDKQLLDSTLVQEVIEGQVFKELDDSYVYSEELVFSYWYYRHWEDTTLLSDSIELTPNVGVGDTSDLEDENAIVFIQAPREDTFSISDEASVGAGPGVIDSTVMSDEEDKTVGMTQLEPVAINEVSSYRAYTQWVDEFYSEDTASFLFVPEAAIETFSMSDAFVLNPNVNVITPITYTLERLLEVRKELIEVIAFSSGYTKQFDSIKEDLIAFSEEFDRVVDFHVDVSDTIRFIEDFENVKDVINTWYGIVDVYSGNLGKGVLEDLVFTEDFDMFFATSHLDTYTFSEAISSVYNKVDALILSISDTASLVLSKPLPDESFSISEFSYLGHSKALTALTASISETAAILNSLANADTFGTTDISSIKAESVIAQPIAVIETTSATKQDYYTGDFCVNSDTLSGVYTGSFYSL